MSDPTRAFVIKLSNDELEKFRAPEWYELPTHIPHKEVLDIGFVIFTSDTHGGALYSVSEFTCYKKAGVWCWKVRFSSVKGLTPKQATNVSEDIESSGWFLHVSWSDEVEAWSRTGEKIVGKKDSGDHSSSFLSLDDGQRAVANFYGVSKDQVTIQISSK